MRILLLFLISFNFIILLNGLYYDFYLKFNLTESLIIPSIWFGLSILVLILIMLIPRPRYILHLLVLGLTVTDLWYFGAKFIYPEDPANFISLTPEEQLIEARYQNKDIPDKLFRIEDFHGYNRFIYYQMFNTYGYDPFLIDDYLYFRSAIYPDNRLLDLLNVKYIITTEKENVPKDHYEKIADNVYRNKEFLARAFWVNKFIIRRGREPFYEVLRHPEFNYRNTVILEDTPEELRQNIPPNDSIGTPGQPILISISKSEEKNNINITHYSTDKIALESHTFSDGLLVLSELYYPGWKALVDGRKRPIYKTDLVLRSIFLPKGKHRIEFIYDPLSFKLGLYISIFTLFIVILINSINLWKYKPNFLGRFIKRLREASKMMNTTIRIIKQHCSIISALFELFHHFYAINDFPENIHDPNGSPISMKTDFLCKDKLCGYNDMLCVAAELVSARLGQIYFQSKRMMVILFMPLMILIPAWLQQIIFLNTEFGE